MNVTVPQGFRLAGVHCGVKTDAAKEDLTLVVSQLPCAAAGVYTRNRVFGAPVGWNRALTPGADFRAVVVNSGNANACTGERGDRDAREMARLASAAFDGPAEQTLVLSTGIIGEFLPMEKIAAGIEAAAAKLGDDEPSLLSAARGMMTTDTRHKLAGRRLTLQGRTVHVCGMAKGAAMIGPNMATMLCVVLTDAALTPEEAQKILSRAVDQSFNCISVDGHMSTSDTVLLLANGAACATPPVGEDLKQLRGAIDETCMELARSIPADGEGATHLVAIHVRGCATRVDAHRIAKTVAESVMVKTAVCGADPNWGRIVSAAGYAGVVIDPAGVGLRLNGFSLYENGAPVPFAADEVSRSISSQRDTLVELTFSEGDAEVTFWTTDLTAEYVRLNADYHT